MTNLRISNFIKNKRFNQGVWEGMFNPNFNYGEFTIIKIEAGAYRISVKGQIERTL